MDDLEREVMEMFASASPSDTWDGLAAIALDAVFEIDRFQLVEGAPESTSYLRLLERVEQFAPVSRDAWGHLGTDKSQSSFTAESDTTAPELLASRDSSWAEKLVACRKFHRYACRRMLSGANYEAALWNDEIVA